METGDCHLDVLRKKDRREGHRVGCQTDISQDIQSAELCLIMTSGTGFVLIIQIIISITKDFSTQLLLGLAHQSYRTEADLCSPSS